MRRVFASLLFVFLLLASASLTPALAQDPYAEDLWEVVVELKTGEDPAVLAPEIIADVIYTGEPADRLNHIYTHAITGFSFFVTMSEYDSLLRQYPTGGQHAQVLGVTRSQSVTLPVISAGPLSSLPTTPVGEGTQITPTFIQRIDAPVHALRGDSASVDVAVLDTGVDGRHPDLNVVGGVDCTVKTGEAQRWDHDGYGHGTHVAGIIGARNDQQGIVGVAPGASIWSVKVLGDSGSGSTAGVICGLDWLVEHADVVDVANMSLGGPGEITTCGGPDPMHNAMCAATDMMPVVVAAGNSAQDAAGFSPANYSEAISVAAYADFDGQPGGSALVSTERCTALSQDDTLATFSNFGLLADIAAPGTCLLSTLPVADDATTPVGNYGYLSGTSMASPVVAGAIALHLAFYPDDRDAAAEWVITQSVGHDEFVLDPRTPNREIPLLWIGLASYNDADTASTADQP